MYITYCRNQKTVDLEDKTNYRLSVTGGDYRPTWLMRVSDWKKVPGTEAVNGYHTISYCWEQSGEVVKNKTDDEYSLVDNGKHCIVEGYKIHEDEIYRLDDLSDAEHDDQENYKDNYVNDKEDNHKNDYKHGSKNALDADEQEETIDYDEYVSWCKPKSKTVSVRYVTYDELLQQVCKDFQVEYAWYDKICIDQSDPKAKSREIKQMHKIYRNARYTLAIIPEVRLYVPEDFEHEVSGYGNKAHENVIDDVWESCWFKRSWTLEEVMMARRILIVGADTNMFQHSLNTTDIPTTSNFLSLTLLDFGITEQNKGSVNQALAYAHFRTSTKAHDMIYALKNTFSYLFDDIKVSYSTNIKTLFNDFYRHVATNDLSILCFGSNNHLDGSTRTKSTMDTFNLASWTGVAGKHVDNHTVAATHPELRYHIDDTMWMYIKTKQYWKISIESYDRGCFSLSNNSIEECEATFDEIHSINSARYNDDWTDMTTADEDTLLLEWLVNIYYTTTLHMTHYHFRQGSLLTQVRPLTLTEDCEECIVLPILLELHTPVTDIVDGDVPNTIIEKYGKDYYLPVLRECTKGTGRYRAIGIYYIGDAGEGNEATFRWNHSIGRDDIHTDDPKEILNILFKNDTHDVPKEFIIE